MLFEDVLSGDFLTSIAPTLRQRSFGHLPVFWAWLAQILEANASCQKAVGLIQSWCRTCNLPLPGHLQLLQGPLPAELVLHPGGPSAHLRASFHPHHQGEPVVWRQRPKFIPLNAAGA